MLPNEQPLNILKLMLRFTPRHQASELPAHKVSITTNNIDAEDNNIFMQISAFQGQTIVASISIVNNKGQRWTDEARSILYLSNVVFL